MTTAWEALTPRQRVDELREAQGRTVKYLADCAGMTSAAFVNAFAGRPGYKWKPGQREAIARALGVKPWRIWPDLAPHNEDGAA